MEMSEEMENFVISDAAEIKSPMTDDASFQEPAFSPPVRKLIVWYNLTRKDGSRSSSRIFIDWAADIRTSADLMGIEQYLVGTSDGELVSVMVTHWKALES
jgi:hypothetical protein